MLTKVKDQNVIEIITGLKSMKTQRIKIIFEFFEFSFFSKSVHCPIFLSKLLIPFPFPAIS